MNWSHGYNVSAGYTYGFYREMTPDWLNYAALLNGFRVPDAQGAFRYLELGCGQGFGLCLMAACHPQAEFLGVDFNPEHIAHARALAKAAGLSNIRFEEADFSVLAQAWPADYGRFEYVTLHGIISWVPVAVREALVRCLDVATAPGALVYVSYNTLPGWVSAVPLQHMLRRLQVQHAGRSGPQIIQQGIELFDALLGAGASIGNAQPYLKMRLDSIRNQNVTYLVQEYLHESWTPLWFSQMAEQLDGAKLGYVGSASLPENYLPAMLGQPLADVVRRGENRIAQQELIDLAINQSFRRDVYCRGPRGTRRSFEQLHECRVLATAGFNAQVESVGTSFGNPNIAKSVIESMVDALRDGARSIGEIAALPPLKPLARHEAIQVVTLLLNAGHLTLAVPRDCGAQVAAFNRAVCNGVVEEFAPYGCLAARHTGNGVGANDLEMALHTLVQGVDAPDAGKLAARLLEVLDAAGRSLLKDGKALTVPEERYSHAREIATGFIQRTLPAWKRLGVV